MSKCCDRVLRRLRAAPLTILMLAAAAPVLAGVEVKFIAPERFIDAGDSVLDRERMLPLLEDHLRGLAQRHVKSSQDLRIEVREINLAGEVEPHGHSRERVRVMRNVTPPLIELHYALSEGGSVLKQGDARLLDMAYQSHANRYPAGDALRYEKRMLDTWFEHEFAARGP